MVRDHPVRVVYSYAREDEAFCAELQQRLQGHEYGNQISQWRDRHLPAGGYFTEEIRERLNKADVIVLLISSDFLASEYIQRVELPLALERSRSEEALAIPVIVRPTADWQLCATLGELNALPRDGRAVSDWADREVVLANVAQEIWRAMEDRYSPFAASSLPAGVWATIDKFVPALQYLLLFTEYLVVAAERYLGAASTSSDATRAEQVADLEDALGKYNLGYDQFDDARETFRDLLGRLPPQLERRAREAFVCVERDFRRARSVKGGAEVSLEAFTLLTLDWKALADDYRDKAQVLGSLIQPLQAAILAEFEPGTSPSSGAVRAASLLLNRYAESLQGFAQAARHFSESALEAPEDFKEAAKPLIPAITHNNDRYVDLHVQRLGLMARIQLGNARTPDRERVLELLRVSEVYQQLEIRPLLNRLLIEVIFAWRIAPGQTLLQRLRGQQREDWPTLVRRLERGRQQFASE